MNKRMIPYGYRMENGILRTDAEESEVIRRIFRMRLEGTGVYAIGKTLYEEQLPFFSDSRDKTIKKVSAILYKQIYAGAKDFPAIIEKQTFEAVQAMKPPPLSAVRGNTVPTSESDFYIPIEWEFTTNERVSRLADEISQVLRQPVRNSDEVRMMILTLAAERYSCIVKKETAI